MVVEKKLMVTINFYKKQSLQVIRWNKKHLLKQVLQVTYTLEEKFFAVVTFEVCESFLFRQGKRTCSILWISRDEKTQKKSL